MRELITTKKGRRQLPKGEKKEKIIFFIQGKYIIKNNGFDACVKKCIDVLSK